MRARVSILHARFWSSSTFNIQRIFQHSWNRTTFICDRFRGVRVRRLRGTDVHWSWSTAELQEDGTGSAVQMLRVKHGGRLLWDVPEHSTNTASRYVATTSRHWVTFQLGPETDYRKSEVSFRSAKVFCSAIRWVRTKNVTSLFDKVWF